MHFVIIIISSIIIVIIIIIISASKVNFNDNFWYIYHLISSITQSGYQRHYRKNEEITFKCSRSTVSECPEILLSFLWKLFLCV